MDKQIIIAIHSKTLGLVKLGDYYFGTVEKIITNCSAVSPEAEYFTISYVLKVGENNTIEVLDVNYVIRDEE